MAAYITCFLPPLSEVSGRCKVLGDFACHVGRCGTRGEFWGTYISVLCLCLVSITVIDVSTENVHNGVSLSEQKKLCKQKLSQTLHLTVRKKVFPVLWLFPSRNRIFLSIMNKHKYWANSITAAKIYKNCELYLNKLYFFPTIIIIINSLFISTDLEVPLLLFVSNNFLYNFNERILWKAILCWCIKPEKVYIMSIFSFYWWWFNVNSCDSY